MATTDKLQARAFSLLHASYKLVEADYRDRFDVETLEESLHDPNWPLEFDFGENETASIDCIIKKLKDDLNAEDEGDAELIAWIDENEETMRDEIVKRDTSDPIADILRHEPKRTMFTYMGADGENDMGNARRVVRRNAPQIYRPTSNPKYGCSTGLTPVLKKDSQNV